MKQRMIKEVRVEIEGLNDYAVVPIYSTPEGALLLPRTGESIIMDGQGFEVYDVAWHYVNKELTAVVAYVRAPEQKIVIPELKMCEAIIPNGDNGEIVINDSNEHIHQCIMPDIPKEYKFIERKIEVHLCSCGMYWTISHG